MMIDIKDMASKPTIQELSLYINNPIFLELYQYIIKEYQVVESIEYSKDTWLKGWNIKFRKTGKSLCVIYPKVGYITVLVVVSKKEKQQVETLIPHFSDDLQKLYKETKEGMNQRWLMFDIYEHNDFYLDMLKLIQIRRDSR